MREYKYNLILFLAAVLALTTAGRDTASAANPLREKFEEGTSAYYQGDYQRAAKCFQEAIEINPNFAQAYNALGLVRKDNRDKLSEVEWCFRVATEIDPKYAEAYSNLCRAYYEYREYDRAEEACLKALEAAPDYPQAQLAMAWVYLLGKKDPASAITYFEGTLKKINHPTVYLGLGIAYSDLKDSAKVLEIVTQLRGMGKDEMAAELESSIRKPIVLPPDFDVMGDIPVRQAGVIVGSETAPPGNLPSSPGSGPSVSGTMQIRLKGKLTGLEPPAPAPPPKHPGSL